MSKVSNENLDYIISYVWLEKTITRVSSRSKATRRQIGRLRLVIVNCLSYVR